MTDAPALVAAAAAIDVDLAPAAATALCRYLDAMLAENRAVNLTAVREPGDALVLHAVDALALRRALPAPPRVLLDLGTGNGFPGVAAAALWPGCRVILCDRTRKKVDAIGRALASSGIDAEALWLDVAQVRAARPDLVAACDVVTARAVGEPLSVARIAAPLLCPGGRLALWLSAATEAPARLGPGFDRDCVVDYELPAPAARARALAVWRRRA